MLAHGLPYKTAIQMVGFISITIVFLTGKDPDAGKHWRREETGTTEDEMVGWHHWLNGHQFEQAPGVGDGQESLACCSPWGRRVRHDRATELNWLSYHCQRNPETHVSFLKPVYFYTCWEWERCCLDHSLNLDNKNSFQGVKANSQ